MSPNPELEHLDLSWHSMGGEGKWYPKELQSSGPFLWSAQAILYAKQLTISDKNTEVLRNIVSFEPASILITSLNEPRENPQTSAKIEQQGSQLLLKEVKTASPKETRLSRYIPPTKNQPGTIAINFEELEHVTHQQLHSTDRSRDFFTVYAQMFQHVLQQELAIAYMHEVAQHASSHTEIRRASMELLTLSMTALTFLILQSVNVSESVLGHHNPEQYALTTGLTAGLHGILSTFLNALPFIQSMKDSSNKQAYEETKYIKNRIKNLGVLDAYLPSEFVRVFFRPYYGAKYFDTVFIKPNNNAVYR